MTDPKTQSLQQKLAEARQEIRRLESVLVRQRAQGEAVAQEHQQMLHSRSWRVTAPLRWLVSRLRGGKARPAADTEGQAAPLAGGVASLPATLVRLPGDDLESANASCRLLHLEPRLEGVLPAAARAVLDGTAALSDSLYLGDRENPPAIGFIGSRELAAELAFDARVVPLEEQNWGARLVPGAMQFLLLETIWHVGQWQWRYALAEPGGQATLRALLARCREIGLPVVVWFRESPGNLDAFAWLAGEADLCCAADPEIAARLRKDFPAANVEFLPPAIQPRLHNPLRSHRLLEAGDALRGRVVFDGWWDLQNGLAGLDALKAQGLLVVESRWDFSNVRLADSSDFASHVLGCLDPEEKLTLSRLQGAEVFASTPLAGAWASAQGMARAAAAGSLVASLDGATPWLPELALPEAANGEGPLAALARLRADPLAAGRWRHTTWRALMRAHTIAHRLQFMAERVGAGAGFLSAETPRIACLLVTMRPERLEACLERFRQDRYPARELVVVVHDDSADLAACRALVREGEPIRIFRIGRSRSLGACLNFAAAQTDAPYWTKMDDDDLYGPNYLTDMMLYRHLGRFEVFGKPPVFNYLENGDALLWDREWARHVHLLHEAASASSALVAGGTLGGHRRVLEAVPFSERRRGGSDSDFIRRCYVAGLDVLAMDGFNFVRCRSARPGFHTWSLDEAEARRRSTVVGTIADVGTAAYC